MSVVDGLSAAQVAALGMLPADGSALSDRDILAVFASLAGAGSPRLVELAAIKQDRGYLSGWRLTPAGVRVVMERVSGQT